MSLSRWVVTVYVGFVEGARCVRKEGKKRKTFFPISENEYEI